MTIRFIIEVREAFMPTRKVSLTDHYESFIEASIAEGRFANASEAVRAGLSLLERQAAEDIAKLEWLRATTNDAFAALDRGEGVQLIPATTSTLLSIARLRRLEPGALFSMAKRSAPRFLPAVAQDIDDILQWSEAEFGDRRRHGTTP